MKKKTIVTAEIQFSVGDTATVEFLDMIRLGTSLPVVIVGGDAFIKDSVGGKVVVHLTPRSQGFWEVKDVVPNE